MPLAHFDFDHHHLEQLEDLEQPPIFVYGSLRNGLENYGLLRGKTLMEIPALLRCAKMFSLGWYPIIADAPEDDTQIVTGELMILQPRRYSQILTALDELEGYNEERASECLYRRVLRCVQTRSGREVKAWVYVGSEEMIAKVAQEAVPAGDWVQWQREQRERLQGLRGF